MGSINTFSNFANKINYNPNKKAFTNAKELEAHINSQCDMAELTPAEFHAQEILVKGFDKIAQRDGKAGMSYEDIASLDTIQGVFTEYATKALDNNPSQTLEGVLNQVLSKNNYPLTDVDGKYKEPITYLGLNGKINYPKGPYEAFNYFKRQAGDSQKLDLADFHLQDVIAGLGLLD